MEIKKIKCRIISVNPETAGYEIQDFGHKTDESGNKIRYKERRKIINNFISSYKNDDLEISIFDAITPKNFSIENNKILFENKKIDYSEYSIFYMANTLSHYKIWEIDEDTLILEDDLIFEEGVFDGLLESIQKFNQIDDDNKIFYLQISTPWLEDGKNKQFNCISTNVDGIYQAINSDFSGTAAYYIPKSTKKVILDTMLPFCACDRYLESYHRLDKIRYYIPNSESKMFRLNINTMWL
jgi:GR25 family glycosyltransferase involved in LPS biosynthesis